MGADEGVETHHVADLPARTGLGTSSAFTVGFLLGLYALREQMRNKHALALDAIHVEQEVVKEAVGSQDQISAGYGGVYLSAFPSRRRFSSQTRGASCRTAATRPAYFVVVVLGGFPA